VKNPAKNNSILVKIREQNSFIKRKLGRFLGQIREFLKNNMKKLGFFA